MGEFRPAVAMRMAVLFTVWGAAMFAREMLLGSGRPVAATYTLLFAVAVAFGMLFLMLAERSDQAAA